MGQTIIDPSTKRGTTVNSLFRLETDSISRTNVEFQSQTNGEVYQATTCANPIIGANGYILYIKNTDDTKRLILESIDWSFETGGAKVVYLKNSTGTPATTTVLSKHNLNFSSGRTASVDAFTTSGTAITGLSDGDVLAGYTDLDTGLLQLDSQGTIVLGKNDTFSAKVTTSSNGALAGRTSYVVKWIMEAVIT